MDFNFDPYYDDFQDSNGPRENNYMRILFKPGYAVQARELTQLQSILQNQIKQFGDHVFKDGSPVIGGHLTLDTRVKSIKLNPQYALEDIDLSLFANQLIREDSGTTSKRAVVVATDDTQTYPTLMIRYLRGTSFANDETIRVAASAATKATLISASAETTGSVVSINEGVFYVNGFFVHVPEQTIVLDPYSSTPSFRIGLEIDETLVDEAQDSTLLDPAQGSFNYQAPGADRYQFSLVLAHRTLDSTDDSSFFELLRVENGVVTKQIKYPLYSEIEKTLARRTYDESGDYTVYPFRVTAQANSSATKFDLEIESGKAYIKGFEFETIGSTILSADKARTSSTSKDYDLSLEYGNYVAVANLFSGNNGIVDTSAYGTLDLHTVPVANINTSGVAGYSNTKIGSARIRNITRRNDSTFYVYLLDINTSPTVVTVASASLNANSIVLPATFSAYNNAYTNVAISITAGNANGDYRMITSYDGTTKTAFVDRNFSQNAAANTVVSLNYAVKDIDSIVQTPASYATSVYAGKDPTAAIYTNMDIDVSSKTAAGNTYLSSTNLNRLVFKFPEQYVAQNLFSNADFYHRKLLTNQTFDSSGNLTISSGSGLTANESFYFGSDGAFTSSAVANTNFMVLVKNKQSSNTSNGAIINLARTGSGIYRTTSTQATINTGHTGPFTADVFVNLKVSDTEVTYRRSKTLYGNTSNTALRTTDRYNNGTAVTGASDVYIDTSNGFVWFTNTSNIVKTPGVKQSLYLPDVISIIKIFDSGNTLYAPNVQNTIYDITSNYLFDSGQTDNYYDHASIILRDSASPPRGQTAVMLQFYDHSSTLGYFDADSYSSSAYANNQIPLYSPRTSETFSLRDAIDFRPTRDKLTTATTFTGLKVPNPDFPMEVTYGFYLPRIDKLVATKDKEFKLLTGSPSIRPVPPSDSTDGMTLYTVYIPPYTANIRDIKLTYHENKRYTMRDIGRLEKRIEQVEYYTTLSLLEAQARSASVLYENAVLEKEKYGIVVDQFDGFNIADNKNPDLICQLSYNELKPYKITTPITLQLVSNTGAYGDNDKSYSLAYTETPAITQNAATKAISVQPYLFGQFVGQIRLTPETDYWVSSVLAPIIATTPGNTTTPATPPVVAPSVPTTGTSVPITWNSNVNLGSSTLTGTVNNLTYIGYGFVNWQSYLNTQLQVPVSTQTTQQTIIAPDATTTLAVGGSIINTGSGGGGKIFLV